MGFVISFIQILTTIGIGACLVWSMMFICALIYKNQKLFYIIVIIIGLYSIGWMIQNPPV